MRRIIPVTILFLAIVATLSYIQRRTTRYDYLIAQGAARHKLDFHLVKSLIYEESWFNHQARGKSGEVGLMQITPAATDDYIRVHKKKIRPLDLYDPELNIEVGSWYLRTSIDRYKDFEDPLPYALARYNAGEMRVNKWLEPPPRDNSEPARNFLERIDYPSTRHYVESILRRYALHNYYF
jgi:soluble lytic murein transglycosylase